MAEYKSLEFRLLSVEEVENAIFQAMECDRPFSLVRIGDGEGQLLGLNESYSQDDLDYFADHFGEVDRSFLVGLQADLKAAILGADLVGIRDDMIGVNFGGAPFSPELVKSSLTLRRSETGIRPRSTRRLYNTVKALAALEYPDEQRYCSQWIHFRLQLSGFFERVLRRQRTVAIITSKPKVAALLRSEFGLDVRLIEVPDKFKLVKDPTRVYQINLFRHVDEEIKRSAEGRLFLIGAGLWGKVFAHTVRTWGGYALDIGALIDCWVGKASRPMVMADLFGESFVRGHVPPEMRLGSHGREGGGLV